MRSRQQRNTATKTGIQETLSFNFSSLSFSWKILITGFLLIIMSGYIMAAMNAAFSVGLSAKSIADHYRDQTLSSDEEAIMKEKGFVEEEFSLDEDESSFITGTLENMPEIGNEARSITPQQLAQLAHVHLLGFSTMLLSIGALICLTTLSEAIKSLFVLALFLSFSFDIAGLYLVRFISENFAFLTWAGGGGIGVCLACATFCVLSELWGQTNTKKGEHR